MCEAKSLITGRRCRDLATGRYRCGCVHEHMFVKDLCALHAHSPGLCSLCQADHECMVMIVPDTPLTAA